MSLRAILLAVVAAAALLATEADAATVAGAAVGDGATRTPKGVTHTIVIDGSRFEPASLTVARGDRIVWMNKDPFPHTATAAGVFDSGPIAAGRSWTYVARSAGSHAYLCTLHPNMKGTLAVR